MDTTSEAERRGCSDDPQRPSSSETLATRPTARYSQTLPSSLSNTTCSLPAASCCTGPISSICGKTCGARVVWPLLSSRDGARPGPEGCSSPQETTLPVMVNAWKDHPPAASVVGGSGSLIRVGTGSPPRTRRRRRGSEILDEVGHRSGGIPSRPFWFACG